VVLIAGGVGAIVGGGSGTTTKQNSNHLASKNII
jgi:hypothetical protein